MTVCLHVGSPFSDCPPFVCSRTSLEISEEEGSYVLRFYHWFLKSPKSFLLLLAALPCLIDTLAQLLAQLKVPAIMVYDVAIKVRQTE